MKKDYTLVAIGLVLVIAIIANLPGCYSSGASVMQDNIKRHEKSDLISNDMGSDSSIYINDLPDLHPEPLIHVEIPPVVIKQINVVTHGDITSISVWYVAHDGCEYAYDNMTIDQFQEVFGFIVSTEE